MALTPEDRDRFIDFVSQRQMAGEVFGWSLDESARSVKVFVPKDREVTHLPASYAGIEIEEVFLPTPKEQGEV